jgi:hypothetical protein
MPSVEIGFVVAQRRNQQRGLQNALHVFARAVIGIQDLPRFVHRREAAGRGKDHLVDGQAG